MFDVPPQSAASDLKGGSVIHSSKARAFAALVAATTLIAACGDDDDSAETAAESSDATEVADTSAPVTSEASSTESSSAAAPTTAESTTAETAPESSSPSSSSAASSGDEASAGTIDFDVAIGVTNDMSGPLSSYGTGLQSAWSAAFADYPSVDLEFADDQNQSANAIANARKFIDDGKLVIAGTTVTDNCLAVEQVTAAESLTHICEPTPFDATDPAEYPSLFGMLNPNSVYVSPILDLVASDTIGLDTDAPNIGIIAPDTANPRAWAEAVKAEAPNRGWAVVAEEYIPVTDLTNSVAQVQSALAESPDVILTQTASQGAIALVNNLRNAGFQGPIIQFLGDGLSMNELKDPNYFQSWGMEYIDPENADNSPEVTAMVDALEAQGVERTAAAVNTVDIPNHYAVGLLLAEALKSCGEGCTTEALAEALHATSIDLTGVTIGEFGYVGKTYPGTNVNFMAWSDDEGRPTVVSSAALG
jgi:branched-chain amino acid transport system substrate-binding protein